MATGSCKEPYDELCSQFLLCPLCLEEFVTPKVLPCQHTFCLKCLRSYVASLSLDRTVPCPMCKEVAVIPGNDVLNFKNNFMVVSLQHFVQESRTTKEELERPLFCPNDNSEALCGACGERETLINFCQLCTLWLCAVCSKAHGRLPATSCHPLKSSEEIDQQCKSMVAFGEKALGEFQQANSERQDFLLAQVCQLPENVNFVKNRIDNAVEEACKIIRKKASLLHETVEQFQHNQDEQLSVKLTLVEERTEELGQLQSLLNKVKLSNDGFQNQNAINQVERFMMKSSVSGFSAHADSNVNLAFSAFSNNLTELKNMEIGQLQIISNHINKDLYLHDRPLGITKIGSLVEREYITGLAISKFADKFIVTDNQYVRVLKPDSKLPKFFLSPDGKRNVNKPWGIAYSEDERRIYISEAGRHEGDGAVLSYSYDGSFQGVVASGLTLPRGIALHKDYLFVCDQIDKCVYILSTQGKVVKVLKKTADGKNLFTGPMFISVGKKGEIAVSDSCTSVKVFDRDYCLKFTYTSSLAESQFWDVHVLQNGAVLICDWKHGLHKISPQFIASGLVSLEPSSLREPSALASLENGNSIYVGTCGGEIYSAI